MGSKNLSDLFRQQAQTSQDEFTLLAAQNRIRRDQISLLRKLRLDVSVNYHFVEPVLEETATDNIPKEDKLISEAIEQRVDLKASNDVSRADEWDVKNAFGTYLPKLDFVAGLSSGAHYLNTQTVNGVNMVPASQTDLNDQLANQVDYTIGISLTWIIFDRLVTNQNVSHAQALAENAAINAKDRKLQVQGEVRQAYGNYLTALQQLKSSKKGFEAAQKAYEVMDGRYGVGATSFLDLITSQTALIQAESSRAQAIVNYQLQDRSLAFAVGNLETL